MSFDFILIALVAKYLQRSLKTAQLHPQWNNRLIAVFIASIVLFIAGLITEPFQPVLHWLGIAALAGTVYLLIKEPVFKPARAVLVALLPYVAVEVFEIFTEYFFPGFYKTWKNTLSNISMFTVFWGVGVWFVSSRQRKELAKTRNLVIEQKEKNRLMAEMKDELEKKVVERTQEISQQKEALEKTLTELKSTQAQLIHSEKMASLGELTAGIAHEIQNPLNFVNNFSEVSAELISEMNEDLDKGNMEDAKDIANDIKQNLEKINFHGKRADNIVKGMLQHSRGTTGQREPTNINNLADEYLRLSFHGLRAKDKSFNAKFEAILDPTIPLLNVVPQDIGRVILNLLNNAFYAVNEKKKIAGNGYQPEVTIQTKNLENSVEVIIRDNGTGMPPEVIKKIFQPFFTTKPTGEGTGLGLSISYDIIKVHGGELSVLSEPGESTTFKIVLPSNKNS